MEVIKLYILNPKKLAQEKVEHIKKGFSAYVESPELADLIKKEIQTLNLDVFEDATDIGFWFIPNRDK
jgi:hypothetical protein